MKYCPNCGDELEALDEKDFVCWSCELDYTSQNGGMILRSHSDLKFEELVVKS